MKNKRGLSTIVIILIIVLLSLVATGIVWLVVKGIIGAGVSQIEINAKCMEIDVKATDVVSTSATVYDVTLTREGGSEDEIGGVKLVFTNVAEQLNNITDVPGNIGFLDTITESGIETGIPNVNKVEVVIYFIDESGNEQLCSKINSYNF